MSRASSLIYAAVAVVLVLMLSPRLKLRTTTIVRGRRGYRAARHNLSLSHQVAGTSFRPLAPFVAARRRPPSPQNVTTAGDDLALPDWASDKSKVALLGWHLNSTSDQRLQCLAGQGSQSMEDVYAYNAFFFGKAGGVFLETGALNGVHLSNTINFEQQLGWRGLLIEASPWSYSKLAANRPAQLRVHAALCREAREVHWADSAGTQMKIETAGAVSGIVEFMAPRFKRRFYKWAPGGAGNLTGVAIACLPLSSILERYGFRKINWFSLDVEGAELEVVRSVNFSRVEFDVVSIEADGLNPAKDEEVKAVMVANGFRLHAHTRHGNNDWYVREGFRPSANPLCSEEGCLREHLCQPYKRRDVG